MDSSLPSLAIRYNHTDDENLRQYHEFIQHFGKPYILVVEQADEEVKRTHTHAWIQDEITIDAFRKQLKKRFPLINGNKDFSIVRVKNPDEMLRYVCKGVSDDHMPLVVGATITKLDINDYHKRYWEARKDFKASKGITKTKNQTQSWSDKMFEELKEHIPYIEEISSHEIKQITAFTLKRLGRTGKKLGLKLISEMVLGFANGLLLLHPSPMPHDRWSEIVANKIVLENHFLERY